MTMKKSFVIGAIVISGFACTANAQKATQPDYAAIAKQAVLKILKDPDSAKFENLFIVADSHGPRTICGVVNAKNGYGGYNGATPFGYLIDRDKAVMLDTSPSGSDEPQDTRSFFRDCLEK
jgi:hypothetical protein